MRGEMVQSFLLHNIFAWLMQELCITPFHPAAPLFACSGILSFQGISNRTCDVEINFVTAILVSSLFSGSP
jgi:hypothetical protein